MAKQIIIKTMNAVGWRFKNLTSGSIHDVIDPPLNEKDNHESNKRGFWVMGVGGPVLVLRRECEVVR